MKLQPTERNLEKTLGILENIVVFSFDIEYVHNFAIVDFRSKLKYDVILGLPFMCQLKVIQDWYNNYVYLRNKTSTKQINT